MIGKGSFGQVLKVYDHKTHQHVALKMVRNEKRFHRQAQEEIRILEHLRKQDKDNTCNIIHMFDNFSFRWLQCSTPWPTAALWFNRGMGPKLQGFLSGLISTVCIYRLCQRESMMATLSPGLKHQCTMEKTQQI